MKLFARAPGKVNLSLFVGSRRPDGRHELITLIESVSLADELELVTRVALDDEVVCPGVEEPNIVSRALAGLRDRGWEAPRVEVTIRKHIPIAAGMGGGSADAAAVLRMAARLARIDGSVLEQLAAELGSDVPSQLAPGLVLGTGAGDDVEPRAELAPHAFVIVPLPHRLSTASVYAEADRLGRRGQRARVCGEAARPVVRAQPRSALARSPAGQRPRARRDVAVPGHRARAGGGARVGCGPCVRVRVGADCRRAILGGGRRATGALVHRRRQPRSRPGTLARAARSRCRAISAFRCSCEGGAAAGVESVVGHRHHRAQFPRHR